MKKIISLFIVGIISVSCYTDDEYENYNIDPKNPLEVDAAYLFASATKSLFDQMVTPDVNNNIFKLIAQYWTPTTYTDEANYLLTRRNIPQNFWSELYRDVLFDLQDSKRIVQEQSFQENVEENIVARIAQITVLEVLTWSILVDTFGDIPYSEALKSGGNLELKYDDDKEIYNDLFRRLNEAIAQLNCSINSGIEGLGFESDLIYRGDLMRWKKFANSIRLRLGMRLADVDPNTSVKEVNKAIASGVFESNEDNASFLYLSSYPNANPIWENLVRSNRNDYVAANTIVDQMNRLEDPRRQFYFDDNLVDKDMVDGKIIKTVRYEGGTYGVNSPFDNFSHVNTKITEPNFEGLLIDYVEVSFLLAEAAARSGYRVANAKEYYNNGIKASIMYWGGSEEDAKKYLEQSIVNYDSASGTWREKIGLQFWLGLYNRGFSGWSVYRVFDSPKLNIPPDAKQNCEKVPKRFTYPINEQNLNPTNYEKASSAIGGDAKNTRVFWDLK